MMMGPSEEGTLYIRPFSIKDTDIERGQLLMMQLNYNFQRCPLFGGSI